MSLAFDLTPTIVNRTAIFHVALDTARAFASTGCTFRYARQYVRAPIENITQLNKLRRNTLQEILGNGGLIRERQLGMQASTFRRPKDVGRIFFFDPLYVLFENAAPEDIVLFLDLSPLTNPEWHNPHVAELYRIAFERTLASGARAVSISHFTAHSLWANYGLPLDEITVLPLYLRGSFTGSADHCAHPQKKLLFVGSLETRKNIRGLIAAFNQSDLAAEGFELFIAGGNGHGAELIRAAAKDARGVHLLGFVPDEQLRELYATSSAFVYPSYLEGFGLPILEAARAGLPIMTSITGATAEVAPPNSVLVDPLDLFSIAEGLRQIALMPQAIRANISALNREYVQAFTFERYLTTVKQLCNSGSY